MIDISKTIAPKSDQLNADDLIGGPKTIEVTKVTASDTPEQPISIFYKGDNGKPYKPCKSMRRVLVKVWGINGLQYVGRQMTLYRDDTVKFGGVDVGGIRISHVSHIKQAVTMALTATRTSRKPYTVQPLAIKSEQQEQARPIEFTDELKSLKISGDEAASLGTVYYNNWRSKLTDEVKPSLAQFHKEWLTIAREADASYSDEETQNELQS